MNPLIRRIQESVREGRYRLSSHAESEREAEGILISEIEEALVAPQCEVVENYANDPRGHSVLVLGFIYQDEPLHVLLGLGQEDIMVVITVYRPDPAEWINWRARRGQP